MKLVLWVYQSPKCVCVRTAVFSNIGPLSNSQPSSSNFTNCQHIQMNRGHVRTGDALARNCVDVHPPLWWSQMGHETIVSQHLWTMIYAFYWGVL